MGIADRKGPEMKRSAKVMLLCWHAAVFGESVGSSAQVPAEARLAPRAASDEGLDVFANGGTQSRHDHYSKQHVKSF